MSKKPTSYLWDNSQYHLYELSNASQTRVLISDLGATIVSIDTLDMAGKLDNIVLGYDSVQEYIEGKSYLGATVGPWANRIDQGCFELDGSKVQLELNEPTNHLHGASAGFHLKHWQLIHHSDNELLLAYTSTRGEAGFDAELTVQVSFTLSDQNELTIDYKVNSDRPCPVNMTNHSYFNLNPKTAEIWRHELQIAGDSYLATNENNIPIQQEWVENSHFDFRQLRQLSFDSKNIDIDHCYLLNQNGPMDEKGRYFAAYLHEPLSGRSIRIDTTEPGIQLYTGKYLPNFNNREGKECGPNSALCLETQQFPDAVNSPDAESVILRPGQQYRQSTKYRFNQ